jgi:hypothetical protein
MMINEAVLTSTALCQIDADGIRLRQDDKGTNDAEFFLSFDDLRDINALVDALGRKSEYMALRERYASPLFEKGV